MGAYLLFTPGTSDDAEATFSSRFHDNELTIRNLYINRQRTGTIYVGLLGRTSAVILDSLDLVGVEVKVESTGGIAYAGEL